MLCFRKYNTVTKVRVKKEKKMNDLDLSPLTTLCQDMRHLISTTPEPRWGQFNGRKVKKSGNRTKSVIFFRC